MKISRWLHDFSLKSPNQVHIRIHWETLHQTDYEFQIGCEIFLLTISDTCHQQYFEKVNMEVGMDGNTGFAISMDYIMLHKTGYFIFSATSVW